MRRQSLTTSFLKSMTTSCRGLFLYRPPLALSSVRKAPWKPSAIPMMSSWTSCASGPASRTSTGVLTRKRSSKP
ncbi:hypothetical protein ACFFX0_09250 [Citricoccus parietis]|uniref:Secreted protein n=1 Tax=Citricoccus parietis TaxID=592307 RepID=A0ABV5FXG5_9MICC